VTEQLFKLLELRPRAEHLRKELALRFRDSTPEAIEDACIDGLEENLALLCVLFYRSRPSSSRLVRSIASNDCFSACILYLILLDRNLARQPSADWRACVDTITDLLSSTWINLDSPQDTVHNAIASSYLLATALRNSCRGMPLLERVDYENFPPNTAYLNHVEEMSLHELVRAIRLHVFFAT
jgi:hypothetical protein